MSEEADVGSVSVQYEGQTIHPLTGKQAYRDIVRAYLRAEDGEHCRLAYGKFLSDDADKTSLPAFILSVGAIHALLSPGQMVQLIGLIIEFIGVSTAEGAEEELTPLVEALTNGVSKARATDPEVFTNLTLPEA